MLKRTYFIHVVTFTPFLNLIYVYFVENNISNNARRVSPARLGLPSLAGWRHNNSKTKNIAARPPAIRVPPAGNQMLHLSVNIECLVLDYLCLHQHLSWQKNIPSATAFLVGKFMKYAASLNLIFALLNYVHFRNCFQTPCFIFKSLHNIKWA